MEKETGWAAIQSSLTWGLGLEKEKNIVFRSHPTSAPLCCSLPREESAPLEGATAGDGEEHDDVGGGDGGGQLALGGRREAPDSRGVAHGRLQRGKASCAWLHYEVPGNDKSILNMDII